MAKNSVIAAVCVASLWSSADVWAQADRDIDITSMRLAPGSDPLLAAEGAALTAPGRFARGWRRRGR